jgi:peroxin-11B
MRLGKPLEHLQAALRAAQHVATPAEQITTIGRQLGYAGYLIYDVAVWVSVQLCEHKLREAALTW